VGVDVSIEAVGYPETLLTTASLVRPGGTIANVGVHGVPVSLPMQDMWIQNVTLTMGLAGTVSIPGVAEDGGQRPHPGGEDGHSFVHLRPDGRGLRRV
jgi:alcohol dehydrogenase